MFDVFNPQEELFTEVQKKLSGSVWCLLLRNFPEYEKYFTEEFHEKLSGRQWIQLLKKRPIFEKYLTDENLKSFSSYHWITLVQIFPKFINSMYRLCDYDKMNGNEWVTVLGLYPQFENFFDNIHKQKLDGYNWSLLLRFRPEFEKYFRAEFQEKLSGTNWRYLLDNQPQFLKLVPVNFKFVLGCGDKKRAIWIDVNIPEIIHIGCFVGTKEEAIEAISEKYTGKERDAYIAKVEECFALVK